MVRAKLPGKRKNYSVYLEKKYVEEAEEYQKTMAGSFNLSSLLNNILKDWLYVKSQILEHLKKLPKEDREKLGMIELTGSLTTKWRDASKVVSVKRS